MRAIGRRSRFGCGISTTIDESFLIEMESSVRRQGRIKMWFLIGITLGIYSLFWYERVNADLAARLGIPRTADSRWWSQLIPVLSIVGVHATAQRINALAGRKVVSPVASWLFFSWFVQTSYVHLQGGVNRTLDLNPIANQPLAVAAVA